MLATETPKIPAVPARLPAEDYDLLRKTGIEYLQKISGKIWTDYNVHDPGVTMLELLCYALTDLGYRTSFDINDLLTDAGKTAPTKTRSFFSAKKILTSHPVSVADYRKMLIDQVPGLRNVWILTNDNEEARPPIYYDLKKGELSETQPLNAFEKLKLKGLYTVKLEMEEYEIVWSYHRGFLETLEKYRSVGNANTGDVKKEEFEECCINYVCALLRDWRNLCEDVDRISAIKEERVGICADIELKPDADAKKVWFQIYNDLYNYISPGINLYTFEDLLNKGKRIDEIFLGSIAKRGFIDYDELARFDHRDVIYTSDLVNIIMDIEGVQSVKDIHLSSYKKVGGSFVNIENAKKHCLHLSDPIDHTFRLALDFNEVDPKKRFNRFNFNKGLIYFDPPYDANLKIKDVIDHRHFPGDFQSDLPWPTGTHRDTAKFYSIQNEFPKNYMLGQEGVPDSASTLRQAQRMQLKAYLVFFEQLLADYLAQLSNFKTNLSWNESANKQTYYYQDLRTILTAEGFDEINDIQKLIENYKPEGQDYSELLEDNKSTQARRNRFLDHLLARFNEKFIDYSLFRFEQEDDDFYQNYSGAELIDKKISFLTQYPKISAGRSHALNYSKDVKASGNISGLEYRVSRMLGVTGSLFKKLVNIKLENGTNAEIWNDGKYRVIDNRTGSFESVFGMHVIEHILLRPLHTPLGGDPPFQPLNLCRGGKSGADCEIKDTYSMKISVVLPGWLKISEDMYFRSFIEQCIRMEAPAHIGIKICWLNPAQMYELEKAYVAFMNALLEFRQCNQPNGLNPNPDKRKLYIIALDKLGEVMSEFKNTYPPSVLMSCDKGDEIASGDMIDRPVILNHSALPGVNNDNYVFVKS